MSQAVHQCTLAELPAEGQAKEFTIGNTVLCVATVGGKTLAINNVCPHRGGPLAEGTVEGGKMVCPWHQWEIDLTTGEAVQSPGTKTEVYAITVTGNDVLVTI